MRHPALLLCLAALASTNCAESTAPEIASTAFAPALNIDLPTMTRTASGLYYKDLVVGTGAVVATGQQVSIHYVGNLPNGSQFDINQAPTTPFTFQLGAGGVIQGFDEGIRGMHIGGQRQMIIPPDLGYGSKPSNGLPGNSILVFTVEVVTAH